MRFRATWAALLTAIMLSFAFAAPACETACDLKSAGPGCHRDSGHAHPHQRQQMHAMDGMEHSAMPETTAAAMVSQGVAVLQACVRSLCAEQPFLLSSKDGAVVAPLEATGLIAVVMSSPGTSRLDFVRGSPHLQRWSPIVLHTTLRV